MTKSETRVVVFGVEEVKEKEAGLRKKKLDG